MSIIFGGRGGGGGGGVGEKGSGIAAHYKILERGGSSILYFLQLLHTLLHTLQHRNKLRAMTD